MKRAKEEDVEGLMRKPPSGAPPRLSEEQRERLLELLDWGTEAYGIRGGGVDVREGGEGNPQGVRGELLPSSRKPPCQSIEVELAETGARGERDEEAVGRWKEER